MRNSFSGRAMAHLRQLRLDHNQISDSRGGTAIDLIDLSHHQMVSKSAHRLAGASILWRGGATTLLFC